MNTFNIVSKTSMTLEELQGLLYEDEITTPTFIFGGKGKVKRAYWNLCGL